VAKVETRNRVGQGGLQNRMKLPMAVETGCGLEFCWIIFPFSMFSVGA
jgi:hypothetical protein